MAKKCLSTQSEQGCPLICVKQQKGAFQQQTKNWLLLCLPEPLRQSLSTMLPSDCWDIIDNEPRGSAWGTQLLFRYSSNSAECPVSSYQWALTVRPYSNSNRRIISVPLRYPEVPLSLSLSLSDLSGFTISLFLQVYLGILVWCLIVLKHENTRKKIIFYWILLLSVKLLIIAYILNHKKCCSHPVR